MKESDLSDRLLRSFRKPRKSGTPLLFRALFGILLLRYETGGASLVTRADVSLFPYLHILFAGEVLEHAVLMLFGERGVLVSKINVGRGTEHAGVLDLSRCVNGVKRMRALSAILVHNHPGGTAALSGDDRETAERVSRALRSAGVRFEGQIVLSDGFCRAYSFSGERSSE